MMLIELTIDRRNSMTDFRVAAVKWDELTGVGKAVLRERVWQWTSERRSFAKWYQDNHHLVVDSDGKDLKPMKPVLFVCGAPRTGTTLLQSLLGCAPEARSTRLFESTYVVEPSTSDLPFPRTSEAELDRDPRLPRLKAIFNQGRAAFGSDFFDKMAASHPTIGNPNQADEDSVVMWYYGCYLMYEFLTAGEVDSWADMVNDAEWQEWSEVVARGIKRFYQMLGVGFEPSGWWVGKSPYHAQHTVALAKTFPEAHFITPTRDPKQTVASLCRTQEAIINGFMLKPESILNDRRLLGRWTARESWGLRSVGITPEFEGEHAKNCVAVRYEDLVRDPVGTVAVIHKACGLQEPSKGHVEAIEKHLRDQPQGLHGRNKYSLEAYGLVETDLEPTKK